MLLVPRETGLILRCAGKAGNPFQRKQGNRLSCHDQEGRRGSEEAVPGPSVFPSGEPGVSGDFWGSRLRFGLRPQGPCGVGTHVARLEFPRETGLILRCAGAKETSSRRVSRT